MFFVEDVYVCVWGEFVGVCFLGGFGVVFCLFAVVVFCFVVFVCLRYFVCV